MPGSRCKSREAIISGGGGGDEHSTHARTDLRLIKHDRYVIARAGFFRRSHLRVVWDCFVAIGPPQLTFIGGAGANFFRCRTKTRVGFEGFAPPTNPRGGGGAAPSISGCAKFGLHEAVTDPPYCHRMDAHVRPNKSGLNAGRMICAKTSWRCPRCVGALTSYSPRQVHNHNNVAARTRVDASQARLIEADHTEGPPMIRSSTFPFFPPTKR